MSGLNHLNAPTSASLSDGQCPPSLRCQRELSAFVPQASGVGVRREGLDTKRTAILDFQQTVRGGWLTALSSGA